MRAHQDGDKGVTSPAALQALETHSGASVIVIPTLMYEGGAYKAHIRFRTAGAATDRVAPLQTAAILSALPGDAAYRLTREMATTVEGHFAAIAPTRASVLAWLRRLTGGTDPMRPHARTLEAAIAFERGVDAYEQQEYHWRWRPSLPRRNSTPATRWHSRGSAAPPRRCDVPTTPRKRRSRRWRSRQPTRLSSHGCWSTPRQLKFVASSMPPRSLTRRWCGVFRTSRHGSPNALRCSNGRDRIDDAIDAHVDALALDPGRARSELDLCRLYNQKRDATKAKERGRRALERFSTLEDAGGAAQAHLCLDRGPAPGQRGRTGRGATSRRARRCSAFTAAGADYNVARALHHVALVAEARRRSQGRRRVVGAGSAVEPAPSATPTSRPPFSITSGSPSSGWETRLRALEFYGPGYTFHARPGKRRAGRQPAWRISAPFASNTAAADRERGLREVENALENVQKAGNKNLEVICLQAKAAYHRAAAEYEPAERLLRQAEAIAENSGLQEDSSGLRSISRGWPSTAATTRALAIGLPPR